MGGGLGGDTDTDILRRRSMRDSTCNKAYSKTMDDGRSNEVTAVRTID